MAPVHFLQINKKLLKNIFYARWIGAGGAGRRRGATRIKNFSRSLRKIFLLLANCSYQKTKFLKNKNVWFLQKIRIIFAAKLYNNQSFLLHTTLTRYFLSLYLSILLLSSFFLWPQYLAAHDGSRSFIISLHLPLTLSSVFSRSYYLPVLCYLLSFHSLSTSLSSCSLQLL